MKKTMVCVMFFLIIQSVFADSNKNEQIVSQDGRISLNFQDIPVRAVLQLMADYQSVNLVVGDSVTGNMTLRLQSLPWEQALDVILTMQGLEKKQNGDVLLIRKAPDVLAYAGQNAPAPQVTDTTPLHADFIRVKYAKALDLAMMLKDKTNALLSARGSVIADPRTNSIWIHDTATRIRHIHTLVMRLDIPSQQVSIEARIVNMTKDGQRDLGIRFGTTNGSYLSGTLAGATGLAKGLVPSDVPIRDRLHVDLPAIPLDASPTSLGLVLAKLGNHVLLDLELSALESEGRAEIIASPKLMTTNQQAAVIESGEDIPYQESTVSGGTSISFKKAVLRLRVTPHITPDGQLMMDLLINQDSDSGRRVQGVPIILTKSIETTVLVKHGQTIVLGGINKRDKHTTVVRVPLLGQLPIIGHLFGRSHTQMRNEELLIFITPRIMANMIDA